MADEIRINRTAAATTRTETAGVAMAGAKAVSKLPWLVLGIVVVLILVLGFVFKDKLFGTSKDASTAAKVSVGKASGYQAVFLTNGQVYFGKVSSTSSDTITLKDIFYLQVIQQQPLQGTTQEQQQQQQAQQQPQISLVKLGQELHGPVDEMHINRAQVLFWEDLREDGKVIEAINEYKKNPQGTTAPATGAGSQPQTAQPAALPKK